MPALDPLWASLPTTIRGRPFLRIMPVPSDGAEQLQVRGDWSDVFSGAGTIETEDDTLPNHQRPFEIFCPNRETIHEVQSFFKSNRGRFGSFFYSSWRWEIGVCGLTDLDGAPVGLYVTHSRISDLYAKSPTFGLFLIHRGVNWALAAMIADEDGVPIGLVEDITPGVDKIVTSIIASGGAGIPYFGPQTFPDESIHGHWLRYGRFDVDKLEWEFIGKDAAVATVPIIELPIEMPT